MKRVSALALGIALGSSATAFAQARGDLDLEASAGATRAWLDLPTNDGRTQLSLALGFGLRATPEIAVALRGTVDFSEGPTTMTAIGVHARGDRGRYFAGIGPAIAHIHGPADPSRSAMTLPPTIDSLGFVLDVRVGVRLAPAYVALEARPIWAFANDAVTADATLDAMFDLSLAVGVAY